MKRTGALFTRALIEAARIQPAAVPAYQRLVVAVDPAGSSNRTSDETGIVVAALGANGQGYVLQDLSGRFTPEKWARRAVDAYRLHKADRIVVEQNFGGEMVVATIRAVDRNVPVKTVHASRGKFIRAEPIAALYEQGRIHHVGNLPDLEDQMCGWAPNSGSASPDRLDALVWAFTELMAGGARGWVHKLPY
jgi:predicted phage terminase large subunit-like protein